MQSSNLATSLKWAVVGAIAACAIGVVHQAIGQSTSRPAGPVVDGWRVSCQYATVSWPKMEFTVKVENTEANNRTFKATARLVRTEFKGNMASRVVKPGDIVRKELETLAVSGTVTPGGSMTLPLKFRSSIDGGASNKGELGRVSYAVEIDYQGKVVTAVVAAPEMKR